MKIRRMFISALWWAETAIIFVLFLPLFVIVVLLDAMYHLCDAFMDITQDIGEACLGLYHKALKHRVNKEAADASSD